MIYNLTTFPQTFHVFIFIIGGAILLLTVFYPRKALIRSVVKSEFIKKIVYNSINLNKKFFFIFFF